MRANKWKSLSIVLAAAMILALGSGCSGESTVISSSTPTVSGEPSGAPASSETSAEASTVPAGTGAVTVEGNVVTAPQNTYELADFEKALGKELTLTEAPELKEQADTGKIPALKDRLPESPVVMIPIGDQKLIGTYGGTMREAGVGSFVYGDQIELESMIRAEDGYTHNIYAALVEKYWSDDQKKWNFTIRKGIKWSDGEPFTTDDIKFWYDGIATNKEYSPAPPENLVQAGQVAKLEVYDQYNFAFIYPEPYNLQENIEDLMIIPASYPAHIFKEWHPDYTSDPGTLQDRLKKAGYSSWTEYISANSQYWTSAAVNSAVMTPWMCTEKTQSQLTFVRNPYYWAVDAAGQQLPYIDKVVVNLTTTDPQVARLQVLNNDIDLYLDSDINFYSTASGNAKVNVTRWGHSGTNGLELQFNMNIQNDSLKEIFRDKNFRFGVSYAINRQEIINIDYLGLLKPHQPSWGPDSPYYDPDAYNAATEYNVDTANQYLDKVIPNKDSSGMRLDKDGKQAVLNIAYNGAEARAAADIQLISKYLAAVGLKVNAKAYEWSAITGDMRSNNQLEVTMDSYDWGNNQGIYYQAINLGVPYNRGFWCPLWTEWYMTNGASGEKPVPEVLQAIDYYNQYLKATTDEEKKAAQKGITQLQAQNLWVIGVMDHPGYVITTNKTLQNVPTLPLAYRRGDLGRPMTWFFQK